jgi:thiol:disulfide interchange protein
MKMNILAFLLMSVTAGCISLRAQAIEKPAGQLSAPLLHTGTNAFDPSRDAQADVEEAVTEARRTGKRILLDVGGDWCLWCQTLQQVFEGDSELRRLLEAKFVTVKIYYGAENKNEKVLSRYSKLLGVPHFFILESDGTLLHSQHVAELQVNGNYTADKVKEFLTKWAPPALRAAETAGDRGSQPPE